jgi:putative membrane protein
MRALLSGVALMALMLAVPAAAQTGQAKPSAADQRFVEKAAGGSLGEVRLGQLAEQKAASPEVKQFGRHMVDDHTKAGEQLKATLSAKGMAPPTKIDPDAQKAYDRLSKLSGPQFDRAYIDDMVKDHRKDAKLFQDEARNGKDPEIKQFAAQTLPTIQEHLQMVERMAKVSTSSR